MVSSCTGGVSWGMGDCRGSAVKVGEENKVRFGVTTTDPLDELYAHNEKEMLFDDITCEMVNLYCRKNHDYGDSFGESFAEFGLLSSVIRIGDKFRRLKTLARDEAKVKDESIRDTLMDMACYCVMTLVELDRKEKTNANTGV